MLFFEVVLHIHWESSVHMGHFNFQFFSSQDSPLPLLVIIKCKDMKLVLHNTYSVFWISEIKSLLKVHYSCSQFNPYCLKRPWFFHLWIIPYLKKKKKIWWTVIILMIIYCHMMGPCLKKIRQQPFFSSPFSNHLYFVLQSPARQACVEGCIGSQQALFSPGRSSRLMAMISLSKRRFDMKNSLASTGLSSAKIPQFGLTMYLVGAFVWILESLRSLL